MPLRKVLCPRRDAIQYTYAPIIIIVAIIILVTRNLMKPYRDATRVPGASFIMAVSSPPGEAASLARTSTMFRFSPELLYSY